MPVYKKLINDDDNKFIIKAFYTVPLNLNDNSLEVESQIYQYLIPKIVKYSPYILCSYGVYSCPIKKEKTETLMKQAKKN